MTNKQGGSVFLYRCFDGKLRPANDDGSLPMDAINAVPVKPSGSNA